MATFINAHKWVKGKQKLTGTGTIKFQFNKEMDILISEQPDIVFPIVGTVYVKGLCAKARSAEKEQ